jgi:hypothetical protein
MISTMTNVPQAAEHRMYATLLAQPSTWARFTHARCAVSRTAPDSRQQRRVMPPFGGLEQTLANEKERIYYSTYVLIF